VVQLVQALLPLALGVAVSPIPIIAVLIMLLSERARVTGWGFLLGWILGIAVACCASILLGGVLEFRSGTWQQYAAALLALLLGVVALVAAQRSWRRRPRHGQSPALPRWLATADQLSIGRSAGLGVLLSAANPKNLLLCQAAGTEIAQSHLPVSQQAWAVLLFTALAAITVALPVLTYATAKRGVSDPLNTLRTWLIAKSSAVTSILLVVIASVLIVRGIRGLS
jgi:threonine/homoserine/homoserine lactone efflux protein